MGGLWEGVPVGRGALEAGEVTSPSADSERVIWPNVALVVWTFGWAALADSVIGNWAFLPVGIGLAVSLLAALRAAHNGQKGDTP